MLSTARRIRTTAVLTRLAAAGVLLLGAAGALARLLDAWATADPHASLPGHRRVWVNPQPGESPPLRDVTELPQLRWIDMTGVDVPALADLPRTTLLLAASPSLVMAVVYGLAALLAAGTILAIGRGSAFARPTRLSMLALGIVLVVGGTLAGVLDTMAAGAVVDAITSTYTNSYRSVVSTFGTQVNWQMATITAGVVALALAVAFRDGAHLREELDGVV